VIVFLALGFQHEIRMHHTVICGLLCSTMFFHIISQMALPKKKIIELEMCVLIFSTTFV